jgi:hypothetical protein
VTEMRKSRRGRPKVSVADTNAEYPA